MTRLLLLAKVAWFALCEVSARGIFEFEGAADLAEIVDEASR